MTTIFYRNNESIDKKCENLHTIINFIHADWKQLVKKADGATGKIMLVEKANYMGKFYANLDSYKTGHLSSYKHIAKKAMSHARSLFKKSACIHIKNKPALKNNEKLVEKIKLIMSNIGIEPYYTTYEYKTSRSRQKTGFTHSAGYMNDIARLIKTDDDFQSAKTQFVIECKLIKQYIKENEKKELQEKQKKQQQEEIKLKEKRLATLVVKYNLQYESTWNDVLSHLLSLDKYLSLAHSLYLNRCGWNEGYYYAEGGINNFVVETEEDKKIESDILNCISNWDGDGRIFRDTTYNYEYLYGKVDKDLLKDYNICCEAIL